MNFNKYINTLLFLRSTSSVTSGDGNNNNSDDVVQMHSDTDSEGSPWLRSFDQYNRDDDDNEKLPPVLLKPQPKHTYRILRGNIFIL